MRHGERMRLNPSAQTCRLMCDISCSLVVRLRLQKKLFTSRSWENHTSCVVFLHNIQTWHLFDTQPTDFEFVKLLPVHGFIFEHWNLIGREPPLFFCLPPLSICLCHTLSQHQKTYILISKCRYFELLSTEEWRESKTERSEKSILALEILNSISNKVKIQIIVHLEKPGPCQREYHLSFLCA